MAKYTYVGDETRFYQDLELVVNPGDVCDLDEMPQDGRWTAGKAPAPTPEAPETAPEADSAPSADESAPTPTDK